MAMLLTFGVQLFMYATPVIYPLSTIDEKYRYLVEMNPLTAIIENFRYGFFRCGKPSYSSIRLFFRSDKYIIGYRNNYF